MRDGVFAELSGVLRDRTTLNEVIKALNGLVKSTVDEVELKLTGKRLVAVAYPGACSDANFYCVSVFDQGRDGVVMRDYARGIAKIKKANFSEVFGEV